VLDEVGRGTGRRRWAEVVEITRLGGGALLSLRATVRRRRSSMRGIASAKLVPKKADIGIHAGTRVNGRFDASVSW